jgi:transcriptional regulator with XRE-family HTH domain
MSYSRVKEVMNNISSEEFYKRIGKNVAKFRKEKGLSQLELSLEMNYKSISIISSAEICYNGKHFNLEHLLKISQILKIDICDFFQEEK